MQPTPDNDQLKQTQVLSDNPVWLDNFINIYQSLAIDNLASLAQLYHQDITFEDPLHVINGFSDLAAYFDNLYLHVTRCDFVIDQVIHTGNQAGIYWTMTYVHQHLNSGEAITVQGHSLIMGDNDKVVYHRDYIDLGQMLYENVPVLGAIIRWLKRRINQ